MEFQCFSMAASKLRVKSWDGEEGVFVEMLKRFSFYLVFILYYYN